MRPLIPRTPDRATGPLDLELAAEDEAYAEEIAAQIDAARIADGSKPRLGPGTDVANSRGSRGEVALALAYGFPREVVRLRPLEELHDPDVGDVDVRTTGGDRLFVYEPDVDPPNRAHALVLDLGFRRYRIPGWTYNYLAQDRIWWTEDLRRPCYAVPAGKLLDPAWLPIGRRPR